MSKKLRISDDLSLPDEVVTEKLGFIGRTGSGKTYAAQKLAELMYEAGAQFIALDPVGKWWSLRLAADGKSPGLSLPVFGGLSGDIPLEPGAGKMIADVIVDRGISAVVDVSQFESDADKARFVTDFGARLFFRKKAEPSAVHIFVEEAQEFVPQNPQRDEARMLHIWTRIQKLGRNFGIGTSLLTQRPQEVNKKVLNQTELLFVFQLTGPQEREAIAKWIQEKGIDEDIEADLPKLRQGAPHAWSPAWLQISRVVKIGDKTTFDASSTPKVGAKRQTVKELSPIDLEKLQSDMKTVIEKAKADDPRELRRKIAELEKSLAAKPVPITPAKPEIQRVEVPVVTDAQVKRVETVTGRIEAEGAKRIAEAEKLAASGRELIDAARQFAAALGKAKMPPLPAPRQPMIARRPAPAGPRLPVSADAEGREGLTGPERKILDAIAWLESIGVPEPDQTAVAFLAGYTYGGGGFNNPRGALRTKELVEYLPGDHIKLTDAGRALAVFPEEALTNEKLHEKVLAVLPGPEQKLLAPLLAAYPDAMSNEDLAAAAGYTNGAGGYNNPRGRLRTLGLVEYRNGGVAARSILFPESLTA